MHRTNRNIAVAAVGLATILSLSACGSDGGASGSMGGMGHGSPASPTGSGSTAAAGDVVFAQMMIPHHQQAVEMADLALKNPSTSKAVTDLATQIRAAQDPEIETMKRWLREWNAPASSSMGHGPGGMMTEADMKQLSAATGEAFDRMWLTMMVEHHQGAVEMASSVLDTTTDPAVRQLAQAIIEGQNKEIAVMRGML